MRMHSLEVGPILRSLLRFGPLSEGLYAPIALRDRGVKPLLQF